MEEQDITRLLKAWRGGDEQARDRLIKQVYPELRQLARRQLARESDTLTLQVTELVNEAYLRLNGQDRCDWQSRAHFLSIAATLVRRIVIDHAKRKRRLKRGGDRVILSIEVLDQPIAGPGLNIDALALDSVLGELEEIDPISAEVVQLRYFAGLSLDEVAAVTGVSVSTVSRDWQFARAWLHQRLAD